MIVRHRGVFAAATLVFIAVVASSGCASKSTGTFAGSDDGGGADGGDDSSLDSGSSGGSSSGSTGSSSGFQLAEASASSCNTGNGTCKDGMYSGMFQCSFLFGDAGDDDASFDGGGFVITGAINFTVSQNTASGESFIDTASGTLGGTCCLDLFTISANVGGTLNCSTGEFTGNLSGGMYSGFVSGSFNGPLDGCYDGKTSSFIDGTWNLAVPKYGNCVGIWSANFTEQ
jgi:hypothetical protein